MLMEGYYKNPEATVETSRGRYLTVGDVAVRDADGYVYIVDRVKDMIIRGGVNIYPAEIEAVLTGMPAVADAAVVGRSDPEFGESPAAFVVPVDGESVTADQIQEYCGSRLANDKIPATIVFVEEIPRTPTGKILKRELREMLAKGAS
jgi:acyl-CoA synthetase (AMP-forming)/AMP-acid ligase II